MDEQDILQSDRVVQTIERLGLRIQDRFPKSGLAQICRRLLTVAQETDRLSRLINRMLDFYGEQRGLVLFRKHASRYLSDSHLSPDQRVHLLTCVHPQEFRESIAALEL